MMDLPKVDVLFEDNHCLAVAKPAGLATEAPPPFPSLVVWARDYLRQVTGKPGRIYLGLPHRLDRPTSGVLVLARTTKAAQRLAEQFRERQVRKVYWAYVRQADTLRAAESADPAAAIAPAQIADEPQTWVDWVVKVEGEPRGKVVASAEAEPDAKQAEMTVRCLAGDPAAGMLLECVPHTGRFHQIRLQLAARGWPVVGDFLYGGSPLPDAPDGVMALHARALTFLHPISYQPLTVEAPLPLHWPIACPAGENA